MKKCRKILLILAAAVFAFALFALTACGGDEGGDEDAVKVTLDKTSVTLKAGESATLNATVTGSEETVEWTITLGDGSVIAITPNGNACTIKAVAEGNAKVKAAVGEASVECNVKVNPADSGHEDEVSISLSKTSLTMKEGESATLTATVENSDEAVKWAVDPDDDTIISVIADGETCTVTAVAKGGAKITASIGDKTASCIVTVTADSEIGGGEQGGGDEDSLDVSDQAVFGHVFTTDKNAIEFYYNLMGEDYSELVEQIDLTKTTVTVKMDGSASESNILRAYWQAEGVYNLYLQITVESDWWHDYVFAISFKNADGEEVAHATYIREGDTELILSDDTKSISLDDTQATVISIVRVNGKTEVAGLNVSWTIDDTAVATITDNEDGTVSVTAAAVGTATLTCTVGEGANALKATCEIKVVEGEVKDEEPLDVTDQLFLQETYGEYYIGIRLECDAELGGKIDSVAVTATMDGEPVNARVHNVYGTNPKYVQIQVNEDWTHSYVFTIDYKNAAGKIIATGTFVQEPAKSLKLDVSTLNLELGVTDTGTITATTTGKVEGNVEWTIEDTSIATITENEDGTVTVTAVAKGTTTITAKVDGLEETCTVNVVEEGETPQIEVVDITNIIDANDVFVIDGSSFAIHFYFMAGDYGLVGKISLDRVDISVTNGDAEISGCRVGPNSSIGGDNSCHIHAVIPESKDAASGTYVITLQFKDDAGNVIAQGTFSKTI